jgi:hypothetical protein
MDMDTDLDMDMNMGIDMDMDIASKCNGHVGMKDTHKNHVHMLLNFVIKILFLPASEILLE